MTKAELIDAIATKTNLTKKDIDLCLNATVETIIESLNKGEKVSLVGLGTFEVKERNERQGVNPKTMEKITIPARKVPAFKAAKNFKDSVK